MHYNGKNTTNVDIIHDLNNPVLLYCPYDVLSNYGFHWIVFTIFIILGILAIYKQHKQQKEKPTPMLLYISTIMFYLSVIFYGISVPIKVAYVCNNSNDDTSLIYPLVIFYMPHDLHWFLILLVLFLRYVYLQKYVLHFLFL